MSKPFQSISSETPYTAGSTLPVLTVDVSAVVRNYCTVKSQAGVADCAAVVKADCYGLGMNKIVPALSDAGCQTFFVAHAEEGRDLRSVLPAAKIYVFNSFMGQDLSAFHEYRLRPVLSTIEQVTLYENNKDQLDGSALHLDTGLNRYGLRADDLPALPDDFCPSLVMSHLACADAESHFLNKQQLGEFIKLTQRFPDSQKSLSASDGVFLGAPYCFDMVRAGAALYGVNTTPYRENQMEAVVTLSAPVLQVTNLRAGDYVGYGASYKAHNDQRVAVLSIGYADGLPRALGNRGKAWFDHGGVSYAASIIGRISMDMTVVDITQIPDGIIQPGMMASVLNADYTIDDFAVDCDTIGYEALTSLTKSRATRLYL